MIKENSIKSLSTPASYKKGLRYFQQGRVHLIKELRSSLNDIKFWAKVAGSYDEEYDVFLLADQTDGSLIDYQCTCPAASNYDEACKHVVATCKEIQSQQEPNTDDGISASEAAAGQSLIDLFTADDISQEQDDIRELQLEPTLCVDDEYSAYTSWLEFKIGYDKMYSLKNIYRLFLEKEAGNTVSYGKSLTINTKNMRFKGGISQQLWDMLQRAFDHENSIRSYSNHFHYDYHYGGSYIFSEKRYRLSSDGLQEFLNIMGTRPIHLVKMTNQESLDVLPVQGKPPIRFNIADRKNYAQITLETNDFLPLDSSYRHILIEDKIYCAEPEYAQKLTPLLEKFKYRQSYKIQTHLMGEFFTSQLQQWESVATIQIDKSFEERFIMPELEARVYLDYYNDGISARLEYSYQGNSFNPLLQQRPIDGLADKLLIQDKLLENRILKLFDLYQFYSQDDILIQEDEDKAFDFLKEGLPRLDKLAVIFYSDAFSRKPISSLDNISVGVSVNDDNLLEVSLKGKSFNFEELIEILKSYRLKKHYHRLKDGRFITLEEQQLDAVAKLTEALNFEKENSSTVQAPLSKAMYIDSLGREAEGLTLERNRRFKQITSGLRHPDDTAFELPASLQPILRDYQTTGFSWLTTLANYGLGGILADDMGLGKTLQVLSFLFAQKNTMKQPALIVAPTSLIYNWQDEIQKFTPELQYIIVAGTKNQRSDLLADLSHTDLVITTYNMLRSDIECYKKLTFSFCFLDEAQHIKNPAIKATKAVKQIKAACCFALTGTPIENNLTELWSIFDYLMPGYLYSHQRFKASFEIPIVRGQDKSAQKDLVHHVAPFILRRMKKDVLKELPDKIENRMLNEMTPMQSKVYDSYFVQAQKDLAKELRAHGFGESRIKILALLTRLRQIACDPSLFLENYTGGSGKLDMLEEVVSDAVECGNRILIFSQFTSMLKIISQRLSNQGIDYFYLDGQTPARERISLVNSFNNGAVPVFLISLKAGGTGLNLTGADMVIHYDPWWNPAVEDQATDRAYRIGQKNNVQVLKFITKDTIEEKIYELQQKKKALIDQMIQPGETFLTKLSEEEIKSLFK